MAALASIMNLRTWLTLAAHPATVRRARVTALIVGTVLVAINHGPAILAGGLTQGRIFQILLTYMVPYTVSTLSSVATRHEMRPTAAPAPGPGQPLYSATEPAKSCVA
jgi:hypothetical protein